MASYIIRRILLLIPTLWLVTIIVFFSIRLIPGGVVEQMVAQSDRRTRMSPEEAIAEIKKELGLDVPMWVQYGRWVSGIFLRGDLGKSLWTGTPVLEDIAKRTPVSMELGALGLITALIIAIPIGIYSGIRQDTIPDYIGRSFAIACIALPSFWLGTIVMVYPSIWWGWSPPVSYIPFAEDPIENIKQFAIPSFIMGMVMSGSTMRMTRTMMLEVLRQDYIRTAWSKGLKERTVILRHALKNALIPVVTVVGMQLPVMIGGSVILENIFCLPGIGARMIEILGSRDYTVLSGINLVMAAVVLGANLLVDLTYGWLDPRVRYE